MQFVVKRRMLSLLRALFSSGEARRPLQGVMDYPKPIEAALEAAEWQLKNEAIRGTAYA